MKHFIYITALILLPVSIKAQTEGDTSESKVLRVAVIDGDTVLLSNIPEVTIYPRLTFKNRWQYWRYRRLIRNVKAAYPYAKIAGNILKDVDAKLGAIESEKQRKKYVKDVEKEIRDRFEDEVKHLTISQGRILIKLIDRETGNTTYTVLQDIKGNFSAVFWQAIARVFGSTLKSEYDPEGDDYLIEQIILMIDAGQL